MGQITEFFQRKTGNSVIQVGQLVEGCRQVSNDYNQLLLNYNYSALIYRKLNQWNQELNLEQKFYANRETFLINYEQALSRWDKRTKLYYNPSTHFFCVKVSNLNSPKCINYLKKITNPIAIKIGAKISIKNLIHNINNLDPHHVPGRITLIPCLGVQSVYSILPKLIAAVKKTKRTVLWSCDPMQGNTNSLRSDIKIRKLSAIVEEIKASFLIHKKMGSQLNGIHLNATHQDVSECLDYDNNLVRAFKNLMDPRLNYAQTIHVMQCIAKLYIEH